MNQLLDKALTAVLRLPEREQNEIAQLMLDLAHAPSDDEAIDPAHKADIATALEQMRRREFATSDEIAETLRRFGA